MLVHVWSEFGRRGAENASGGTDHGGGGIGFLIGSKLNGQADRLASRASRAGSTAQGNLKPSADFRAVYSAILEQWLDVDANDVIPNVAAFKRPTLLK